MSDKRTFNFEIKHRSTSGRARTGAIRTPHGNIETPAFVSVGTQCGVKTLTPDDLDSIGTQIFFVNTYHAYLRPGVQIIRNFGGLHNFMNWQHPLITDSGGFQVFSLAGKRTGKAFNQSETATSLVKISDDGVLFKSHWDGSEHLFTPESSMDYQWGLGSDIHIAFDDCTAYPVTEKTARTSLERTHDWAVRSLKRHGELASDSDGPYQALYGSIQGSIYRELRQRSAEFICSMDFDGIAIGGVSVGESKTEMAQVLDWVYPYLPEGLPRHLLGVGEIDDIFTLIENGMDTFDCVMPSREARMGYVYLSPAAGNRSGADRKYLLDINKSGFADDQGPIDQTCKCYTCQNFSRGYLHHLFKVRELLSYRLATIHNIYFINNLVTRIRKSISEDSFIDLKKQWL